MLTRLPPEILQRIVILACPLISLSTVNTTPSSQNFQDQQQKSYRLQQQNATKMKNAAATGDDERDDEKEERKAQNTGEGNEQEEEEGVQCVEEDEQDPSASSKLGTTPFISPNFDTSPPAIIYSLSLTCRRLQELVRYGDGNAWLYSRIFERSFDFGAARRRLGPEWAGPHGIAWEGRKRWGVMKRMKRAIRIWERDGYRSTTWLKYYSESDVLQDLWALYFMLLENDGKNAVVLMLGAHLGVFVQMLCTVFFGKAVTKRPGWPLECPERALLVWIIWAVDPSPADFFDQDLYHRTKISMRAFIFGSFKYSLGILPPNYFHHPSALDPSHWLHQVPPSILRPFPLNPYTSSRYSSWILPLEAPVYKYSHDPLHPVTLYGRTVHLYAPSLAVGALLWYFCGGSTNGSGMKGESGGSSRVGSDDEDDEENAENNEGNHERRVQEEEDENMRDVLDSVLPRDITTSPDPVGSPVPTFSVMMNKTTTSLGSVFNLIPALRDHRGWTNPILFSIPPAPSQYPPRIVPRRGSSRSSHTSSSISPAIASQSLSRYQNTATTTTTATATSRFQVNQADITRAVQLALYNRGFSSLSRQLEPEWTRRLEGQMRFLGPGPGTGVGPPYAYTPGSLQGTWEGGFLYLDFPEYAQFLTGEREADAAFYEAPPEKTYGSNRQVWKLKEYELFSDSYPQAEQDLSESIKSLNSTSTRSDIYAAITGGRAAAVMPIGNGTNRNQPLSIGRWKDGWLPPADRLEWRFPEDGSDEVEIVEKVDVVAAATNEETNAKTKLVLQVNKTPELGKKEEETRKEEANEGDWAKEKAGMAGKLRGRPRERLGPLDLASSDDTNPDTSTTPVGRKIPLESPDGRLPQRRQQPEPSQSTDTNMRQTYGGSTSPPPPSFVLQTIQPSNSSPPKSALTTTFSRLGSPTPISPPPSSAGSKAKPFIGEGRTFRWGWKSKKKLEKEKAVERASIQPIEIPGLTDRSRRRASFDYDDRVGAARDQEMVEGVEGAGRQYRSSSAAPPDRKESYDSILEEPEGEEQQRSTAAAAAFEPMNRKEVIEEVQRENVSKYVRWDPDVDWARQAIWGPRPVQKTTETISTGVNSLNSSMTGKLRGHISSSITAGTTSGQSASRGPPTSVPTSISTKVKPPSRYVRDILVFGESFSSWGEATLRGRIRLHDGLVTIVKTYPQRATWVYTGYVVGGENFVGRWRDADSPEEVNGYEGPFAMKRRR